MPALVLLARPGDGLFVGDRVSVGDVPMDVDDDSVLCTGPEVTDWLGLALTECAADAVDAAAD